MPEMPDVARAALAEKQVRIQRELRDITARIGAYESDIGALKEHEAKLLQELAKIQDALSGPR